MDVNILKESQLPKLKRFEILKDEKIHVNDNCCW